MKRVVDKVASKLAEDSHKRINRRRHKSDRRGSVRKLVGMMVPHDYAETLENPCFRCRSVHVREGTLIISEPILLLWYRKLRRNYENLVIESRSTLVRNDIACKPACQIDVNNRAYVIISKLNIRLLKKSNIQFRACV